MKPASEFYAGLHATDEGYSAGTYHFASLWSLRAFRQWTESRRGTSLRVLDVGVGKGLFLREIVNTFKSRWNISTARVTGLDLVRSPGDHFAGISDQFEFVQQDTDGHPLPFPDASFDFVTCNHVLEHVFETENLVCEIRRVISPQGLAIISTPNLAAWINRVALLWACQPLGTELGTKSVTYGFSPRRFQTKLAKFHPSGHIRDFTPRGLHDLTNACGFETAGWWPQSEGLIVRLGKWAGRNMGIVLRPK